MEPLKINVDLPSVNCSTIQGLYHVGTPTYEVAKFEELHFSNVHFLTQLGSGAYGAVMPCLFRGRTAAAKLFGGAVNFRAVQEEAELLHMSRHENIIELYALFRGELSGLILEPMEGGSLSELLHHKEQIAYQTRHALKWAVQVAKALGYLHRHNFIHRDIKPANMLLSRDYFVLKLCDFGTATKLQQIGIANTCGSAAWMAPEVFKGLKYDHRCDIFSFGICLWEMLARSPPFADVSERNPMALLWEVSDGGLRPPPIEGEMSEPLKQLMDRCWAHEPSERPPMDEVVKVLETFLGGSLNGTLPPLVDRTSGRPALANSPF